MKKIVPSLFIGISMTGTAKHLFFKDATLTMGDALFPTGIFAVVVALTFATLLPCCKKEE